ncbi:MAG: cysteine--tRNA ligase, partial [Mesorhizobium sp.]
AVDFSGAGGGKAAAAGNDAAASLKAALLFLGFDVTPTKVDEDAIARAIAKRLALIAAGNWAEADRIRADLLAQGIQLKDGKDPVTGARITTWEVKR